LSGLSNDPMFTLGLDIVNGQTSFFFINIIVVDIVLASKQDKYELNRINTFLVLVILLYKVRSNLGGNVRIYLFIIHIHVVAIK